MKSKGWRLFHEPPEVIPIDDTHAWGVMCECNPYLHDGVIVHNSYDRREHTCSDELSAWDTSVKAGKSLIQ